MSSQLIELRDNSSVVSSSPMQPQPVGKQGVVSYSFQKKAEESAYNKALKEVLKKARNLNW